MMRQGGILCLMVGSKLSLWALGRDWVVVMGYLWSVYVKPFNSERLAMGGVFLLAAMVSEGSGWLVKCGLILGEKYHSR